MGSVLSTVLSNVATYLTGEGGLYTVLGDTGGFFSTYLVQPSDSQAAEILDFDINTLGMLLLYFIIIVDISTVYLYRRHNPTTLQKICI